MSDLNRPTFIDYTPASERSEYFDAPMMHIFSKRKDDDAPVPTPSPSHIRTTTSLDKERPAPDVEEPASAVTQSDAHTDSDEVVRTVDYAVAAPTRKPRQASASDSGYDSPTRSRMREPTEEEFKAIPVVWSDSAAAAVHRKSRTSELMYDSRRSLSLRSTRSGVALRDDGRESVRTTPSGRYTPSSSGGLRRRISLTGGTFANGAGTVGPSSLPSNEDTSLFRSRSLNAESALSKKQKLKIGKAELKEGKLVAKVIKQEAKAEKEALASAVKELADLQKLQKYSVKEEAKTNAAYGQSLRIFHKEELAFFAARARYERAQADLKAHEDSREAARERAREATEMLQEKNREVEWLRAQKAADDREREAKLRQLKGKA